MNSSSELHDMSFAADALLDQEFSPLDVVVVEVGQHDSPTSDPSPSEQDAENLTSVQRLSLRLVMQNTNSLGRRRDPINFFWRFL